MSNAVIELLQVKQEGEGWLSFCSCSLDVDGMFPYRAAAPSVWPCPVRGEQYLSLPFVCLISSELGP
eukprot:6178583-Amphidinium_carterae.2